MTTSFDRTRATLLGLAVGDALGAPVEFQSAETIAAEHGRLREMVAGGPWLAGEWTDDTALALAVAAAYGDDGFDLAASGARMVEWMAGGPKDIGNLTARALRLLESGAASATDAGLRALEQTPGSAGNGSLMRAAPTALVRRPDDPRLVSESVALSAITHADPRCTAACVAFNLALSGMHWQADSPMNAIVRARDGARGLDADVDALLAGVVDGRPPRHRNAGGIGFVLLCLELGLTALRDAQDFESGLIDVVMIGGDTDTNAAVAGALLGARFGLAAIPARWLESLRERQSVEAAVERLHRAATRG